MDTRPGHPVTRRTGHPPTAPARPYWFERRVTALALYTLLAVLALAAVALAFWATAQTGGN